MACGPGDVREVLSRENYAHVNKLSKKLAEGYRKIVAKAGPAGVLAKRGPSNGALMLYPQESATIAIGPKIDADLWRQY